MCIDRVRLQRRQNKTFKPLENPVNEEAASNQQHEQMIEAERTELQEQLSTALMNLPAKLRSVIILRGIQGFCYREIADILGMQMNNVKVSIHRAKKTLKKFS